MKARIKAVERKARERNKYNRVELPLFIEHKREADSFIVPSVVFKAIGINPEKDPKRYPAMGEPIEGYSIKSTDTAIKSTDTATKTIQLHDQYFWYDSIE
jgi:uncharacterized protein YdhG (YjbR/CyaY superfamily)